MSQPVIEIVEVSPRDGLQNETRIFSPEARAELILRAAAAGASRIEAVSFVNPQRVPQMAEAERVLDLAREGLASNGLSPSLIGLVLNERGFRRALAAKVDEVNFVVVASESFNRRNQGVSIAETMAQCEAMAIDALASECSISLTIAASFGCPFEGETDPGVITDLARRGRAFGASEIALADTIGSGVPSEVSERFERVRKAVPDVRLRGHFHNTRNTGFANAWAAVQAGAASIDASVGGIGGCPFAPRATGNIATEDLVYMLSRSGYETGLDINALVELAEWLGERVEQQPPGLVRRAGSFPVQASA